MVLSDTMTQVSGKVQTQPDGGDRKRSGEASRQVRATKGEGPRENAHSVMCFRKAGRMGAAGVYASYSA